MKKFLIIFAFSGLLSAFFVKGANAANTDYQTNSLIINLKDQYRVSAEENFINMGFFALNSLDALNKNNGVAKIKPLSAEKTSSLYGSYQLIFAENKNIANLVAEYKENYFIKYAQPNYILEINSFTPNDPYYSQQWNLSKINVSGAWNYNTIPYGGNPSIIVAVLDTGVAYENYGSFVKAPDLANTNFVPGYDWVNKDNHPNDDNGHGTSIAEIIAASTNNSYGIAGIAFNISIMPVKVMDSGGSGNDADVTNGINWAIDHGANIISMSIGTGNRDLISPELYNAIKRAYNNNIILVASTGNNGKNQIYYPAAYPEVIAVGSTNQTDEISTFSNYGEGLDLVAPGEDILAEDCNYKPSCSSLYLARWWGTSQATPQVTAAAALLLSAGVPENSVESILFNSAHDLGVAGYDTTFGYGRLDIGAAFALAQTDIGAPTTTLTTNPSQPNGNNGFFITPPLVSFSATDINGVAGTYYRVDGGNWLPFTAAFSLTDGKHLVEYYSKDIFNNTEITKSNNIYVDTVAPTFNLNYPLANQVINGSTVLMSGAESDATSGIVSLTINGQALEITSSNFSAALNLSKGANDLTFSLEDRAGLITTLTRKVFSYPKNNILVGLGSGEPPRVRGFNSAKKLTGEFLAYLSTFRGGINIAAADINQDGLEEIITAPKSNGGPQIKVFSSRGQLISQFMAFASTFRGEVNIAAGDVDGDGKIEIIAGAGAGGGPQVRIFDYKGNLKKQFFAYAATFHGGVKVASDDVNGDGIAEIITGTGPGGGPQVRIFDTNGKVLGQFFAFATNFHGGVNIASSDLDNDGISEIIAAPLSSGGPQVRVFDLTGKVKNQFMVYASSFRGGLNLGTGDFNNDGKNEIITSVVSGNIGPEVKVFGLTGNFITNFMGYTASFKGGITVAGFN